MLNPHSQNLENFKNSEPVKSESTRLNPIQSEPTKSLRIAIFTDVFLGIPGGIPSSIRAQKASLEALGHQVTIFCPLSKISKIPCPNLAPIMTQILFLCLPPNF